MGQGRRWGRVGKFGPGVAGLASVAHNKPVYQAQSTYMDQLRLVPVILLVEV